MFKLVVLSSVLALVAAKPSGLGALGPLGFHGLGLGAPWGLGAHLGAPLVAPALAAPLLAGHAAHAPAVGVAGPVVVPAPLGGAAANYRGPVSLAPGQPASIIAQDGRPLDTLSVNADRSVHFTARAVDQGIQAAAGAHAHLLGAGAHAHLLGAGAHAHLLGAGAHAHLLGKRSAPRLGAWPLHGAHGLAPALAPAALALPAAGHLGWRAPVAPLGIGHLGHAGILGPHW